MQDRREFFQKENAGFVVCIFILWSDNASVDLESRLPACRRQSLWRRTAALLRQAGHSFLRAQFYCAFFELLLLVSGFLYRRKWTILCLLYTSDAADERSSVD